MSAIRGDLAQDPRQTLVDDLVPAEVVLPLVGNDSLLSRVLAPLPETPVFDQPSYHLRRVAENGRLVEAELDGGVNARPAPNPLCGYRATYEPVDVRFPFDLSGALLLNVGYFTDQEATVDVEIGSWRTEFQARQGPNEVWIPVPDLGDQFDQVRFSVQGLTTVCIPQVTAGRAELR